MPRWKTVLMFLTTPLPSFLRVRIYRLLGARLARTASIAPLSILVAGDIEIGSDSYLEPLCIVYNLRKFRLGRKSCIRFGAMVYGHGGGTFSMGDFGMLSLFSMVNCTGNVSLGNYVGLAPRAMIYSHGNFFPTLLGYKNQIRDVTVGDFVWLHMNVIVLPGVTIGDNVMVFSQGLVVKSLESGTTLRPDFDKQVQAPMEKYTNRVTPAFEEAWYHNVWSDLPSFVAKHLVSGKVTQEDNRTEMTVDKRTLILFDAMSAANLDEIPRNSGVLIYSLRTDREFRRIFRQWNWIDFKNNLYNIPNRHPVIPKVLDYLELYRAQYFYEWPGNEE